MKIPLQREVWCPQKREKEMGRKNPPQKRESVPKSYKNAQKFISGGTYEELFTSDEEKLPHI
ncbi:MAG: hypothetical protein K6F48_07145 [Paludibacteraceae bacterium]|nr:hypothetical protein [Paludibacteraceae bacterium]